MRFAFEDCVSKFTPSASHMCVNTRMSSLLPLSPLYEDKNQQTIGTKAACEHGLPGNRAKDERRKFLDFKWVEQ